MDTDKLLERADAIAEGLEVMAKRHKAAATTLKNTPEHEAKMLPWDAEGLREIHLRASKDCRDGAALLRRLAPAPNMSGYIFKKADSWYCWQCGALSGSGVDSCNGMMTGAWHPLVLNPHRAAKHAGGEEQEELRRRAKSLLMTGLRVEGSSSAIASREEADRIVATLEARSVKDGQ
jgi:hypothetical protein